MIPIPTTDKLSIYLNDHLAGATGGAELSRRLASSNRDNDYGPVLEQIADEIAEDRAALLDIMSRFDVGRDRLKVAVSWTAEKAGRLKLNGQLTGYSPLSRLEELEGLSVGVQGKLLGWQALRTAHGDDERLAGVDLDDLIARARSQFRRLEQLRRRAAREAFA